MNNLESNKRIFPRIDADCPALYAIGTSKKWQVGILVNMSATGLKMRCKERLLKNISVNIMLKPGKNRMVPPITAKGKVTRCQEIGDSEFEISCKLIEVSSSS
jgi:hypothetical protein